jgi:hypothetical protein
MAGLAIAEEVMVLEDPSEAELSGEVKKGSNEIDEQLDALYAKVKAFLEDSSKEDLLQGQQLDGLKEALTVITAQLNEASYAAFAGNYMSNHPQIIAQIDSLMRQAELPLRYNQDAKDQESLTTITEMRQVAELIKVADPANTRVAQLENFVLNLTNVSAMHYEDKKLTAILRNFNQSAHDGYTTVSDVQQMIAQVNTFVQEAALVTLRKGQMKSQLLKQAQ